MATASDMVKKAASQIGYKESPAGSNNTKYGKWYGMNGEPWCAMFVSWCANEINELKAVGGKFAYCPYWVDHFKKAGQWLDRSEKPRPGDIIFFSNGSRACHVGIVEKRIDSNYVQTIEGNTSSSSNDNGGAVMRRKRAYGERGSSWYILGFGRPDYSGGVIVGWQKDSKGWWYRYKDGTYPKSEWIITGGDWYYFNPNGYMRTGWLKYKNNWYYLDDTSGKMIHGVFRKIGGKWYGFKKSGVMVTASNQMSVDVNGAINLG